MCVFVLFSRNALILGVAGFGLLNGRDHNTKCSLCLSNTAGAAVNLGGSFGAYSDILLHIQANNRSVIEQLFHL